MIGLVFDLLSLSFLPLVSYIVLSSSHILFFKIFLSKDQDSGFNNLERLGIVSIVLACFLISFCQETSNKPFNVIPDGAFIMWGIIGIGCSLMIRRLGFYSGKVLLEVSIPAQLTVFAVSIVKMGVSVLMSKSSDEFALRQVYPAMLLLWILIGASGSLIKIFCKQSDIIVVCGGYQA